MPKTLPVLLVLLSALPVWGADALGRGYTSRACGFDMNRNGTWSEAADCNVCDGSTTDVDGDGQDEDLIYVCGSGTCAGATGNDTTGTGSAAAPYLTISKALSVTNGTGEEDIICLGGTFTNETITMQAGVGDGSTTGFYTVAASGNQVRSFEYPEEPFMIVGWDQDNDGSYPPFDTDDSAVLDGSGISSGTHWVSNSVNYTELAHLKFQNFNEDRQQNTVDNFVFQNGAGGWRYYHDIEVSEAFRNSCKDDANRMIGWGVPTHAAFENIKCTDCGGYQVRDGSTNTAPAYGPWRLQNLEFHGWPRSTSDSACTTGTSYHSTTLLKTWGYGSNQVEILDGYFDGISVNFTGTIATSGSHNGLVIAQCSDDFDIINNYIEDVGNAMYITGSDTSFCASGRLTADIEFNRNEAYLTRADLANFPYCMYILDNQDNAVNASSDIRFFNNICHSNGVDDWSNGVRIDSDVGTDWTEVEFAIVGNTFSIGGPCIFQANGALTYKPDNITFRSNICDTTNTRVVDLKYTPTGLDFDDNVYPSGTIQFHLSGTNYDTLAAWQAIGAAYDPNSSQCDPTYVDAGNGDYHLTEGDTCAKGQSAAFSVYTSVDFDGDARPQDGTWDIGFDEETSGPTTNKCCSG